MLSSRLLLSFLSPVAEKLNNTIKFVCCNILICMLRD